MGKRSGIGSHTKPGQGSTDSWITPKWIIDRLGPFDLDPCEADPQPWKCAENGFRNNGICRPWSGRVWLNPPYGKQTGAWLTKLAEHQNGTALIFARTETKFFIDCVWKKATAVLFIKGRLSFYTPEGDKGRNAGGPNVLVAYDQDNALRLLESGIPGAYVSNWRLNANGNASG